MGFGILFIGYFFTLNLDLKGVHVPPDFIGYLLMFWACNKLSPYSIFFRKTNYTLIALSAISAGLFVSEIMVLFNSSPILFEAELIFIKTVINAVMHFFLFKAIIEISTDVGRTKIAIKCKRNTYITLAILTCQAIFCVPFIDFAIKDEIFRHVTDIGVNFMIILNMIQIFSCYMWICYEGDEEMDIDNANDPLSKLTSKMAKEHAEYKLEKKKSKKKKK